MRLAVTGPQGNSSTVTDDRIVQLSSLVKREGSPQNIALAVLSFLDNDFVTGVCLPVDGGRTIYAPE